MSIVIPQPKETPHGECSVVGPTRSGTWKGSGHREIPAGGLPLLQDEPAATAWFGIRQGPSTFGIFGAFPDEAGRKAPLSGKVAAALMAKAGEPLAMPRVIENVDISAAKLPG